MLPDNKTLPEMAPGPFKVIIIGGGPVGLTAALAMDNAGIDFIVLERRDQIVVDVGAGLVVGPGGLRVFHQLGVLEKLRDIGCEVDHKKSFTADGHKFKDSYPFKYMKKNHGTSSWAFHRAELIQVLYESLPKGAKERVVVRKSVMNIQCDETSAQVTCVDGTIYEGNLVLGADGAHSKTRHLMRKLALQADPTADWDPGNPYTTTYRCMWSSFERPSDMGEAFDIQSSDRSAMYVSGKERSWLFLYERLPEPTKERAFYTDNDAKAFAERFNDFPITATLKVKDVFPKSLTFGMSNLEEGIVKHWSWGRIVLAGDSFHKSTPNSGSGFQNGIQDVVALCNGLHGVISAVPSGLPTTTDLAEMFEAYRKQRAEPLEKDLSFAARLTRLHAWANWGYYLMSRFVVSQKAFEYVMFNFVGGQSIKKALVLDYVSVKEPFQGRYSWVHPLDKNSSAGCS